MEPNQQDIMMFRDGDDILYLAPFVVDLDDFFEPEGPGAA